MNSFDVLNTILSDVRHLNLTGHVYLDDTVMTAHGGYCDVFVGRYFESKTNQITFKALKVAIKRLRVHLQSERDFAKILAREIRVWSRLAHPNILPLLGFVLEGNGYPSLISAWMERGTAFNYVKNNPQEDITPMVVGIAEGVAYLHEQGVVHSDLKAENVLVADHGEPCICDFGISRILSSSKTIWNNTVDGCVKGSVRWMASELLDMDNDNAHTKETDVWAFGMTLYELLTKDLPYADLKQDVKVMFAIIQGTLPPSPILVDAWPPHYREMWSICQCCWDRKPSSRPSMAHIICLLKRPK